MQKHFFLILIYLIIPFVIVADGLEIQDNSRFIENKGQWESNIRYKLPLTVGDVFLEDNLFTFSLYDPSYFEKLHHASHGEIVDMNELSILNRHAYQMKFVNANPEVTHSGFNKYQHYSNYYIGNDRAKWASHVPEYKGVTYHDLYEGVDLCIYGIANGLKYDVFVQPGGDPHQVKIAYNGVDELYLKNGNLHVINSINPVTESKPVAYQVINGKRVEITCNYQLTGNTISFEFPSGYDETKELVIDPELIFSTYSGSTADNWGYTATYDNGGHLFSAGAAFGVGYPLTIGAFQTGFAGGPGTPTDIGISKYTPDGSNLVYSTYLGGNNAEIPLSLVVNDNDELYVYGATGSSNFPLGTNPYDNSFNGGSNTTVTNVIQFTNGSDIFITKFSAAGDALEGSTYIGGTQNDGLNQSGVLHYNYGDHARGEIIVDASDNCYVASSTFSSDFPITLGVYDPAYSSGQEGCVFKFNSDLSNLEWSTYLGGNSDDAAYSVKLDDAGDVFVSGGTASSDILVGSGGLNPSFLGNIDGYVAKLSSDGSSLLAHTYLGTSLYDQAFFVEVDAGNDIYVYGQTLGAYTVEPSGIYSDNGGKQFIHKLNNDLSATGFSTVFGSGSASVNISPTALLVDVCGRVYISGWGGQVNNGFNPSTGTTNGMFVTQDAYRPTTDGSDFYFMVLEKDADSVLYATYFGGTGVAEHCDGGTSRFDKNGIIYQAVCAGCGGNSLFPTTPGVWSTTNNSSNCNLGSIKFQIQLIGVDVEVSVDNSSFIGCAPFTAVLNSTSENAHDWFWDFGDGTTSTEENPVHVFDSVGVFEVIVIGYDSLTCEGFYFDDTATATITILENTLLSDAGEDVEICKGDTIELGGDSINGLSFMWTPAIGLSSDTVAKPLASPDNTTTYYFTTVDTVCESAVDSIVVQVNETPVSSFETQYNVTCEGITLTLINGSSNATEYSWDFGNGTTSSETDPTYNYDGSSGLLITLITANAGGCSDTSIIDDTNLPLIDSSAAIVPNAFSPDGDDINDLFITKLTPELENCVEVKVFNRWGRKVFESSDDSKVWDGTINGKGEAEEGVYYYIVKIKDEEFSGFVELFR